MTKTEKEKREALLLLVEQAVQRDSDLRTTLNVGMKFRFIHDRLQALLSRVKDSVLAMQEKAEPKKTLEVSEDEIVVYVYLYNAQGLALKSWQKMLTPAVFYEHSVNRPIYLERDHIHAFIRSKPNLVQHGYLTVIINKQDILMVADTIKDVQGNPVVKVREGSLHFKKLLSFVHNGLEFTVTESGELQRKES